MSRTLVASQSDDVGCLLPTSVVDPACHELRAILTASTSRASPGFPRHRLSDYFRWRTHHSEIVDQPEDR